MQKISLLFFLAINFTAFAQKGNNTLIAEYEDTLKIIAHEIMNGENEKWRKEEEEGSKDISLGYAVIY